MFGNKSLSIQASFFLCSSLLLAGCQWLDQIGPEPSFLNDRISGYKLHQDLVFGPDKSLTLDLYQPLSIDKNPAEVVILLHGGAWISGDKTFLYPTVELLLNKNKNLAIVNMNYQVTPKDSSTLLARQLNDIDTAIKFLISHADTFNLRKNNYRLAGLSAGGHLALTYAYSTKETSLHTVIGFSAPTELSINSLMDRSLWINVEKLLGKKYGDSTDVFKNASPFHLASFRSPRTMLVYGLRDNLVSPRQGEMLEKKLRLLNVPRRFDVFAQETHETTPQTAANQIMVSFEE